MSATLERTTFSTSRLLDFATARELTAQTGHEVAEWPLVIVKELVDNALDACEEAGIAPQIAVAVDETGIAVRDNGPGLPATTIASILDFTTRTSSREAYVSPTRGAQGNALKTLVAMPFVLDGACGIIEIAAQGLRHRIGFRINQVRQEPLIDHDVASDPTCKNGTEVRVHWPKSACSILMEAEGRFLQLVDDFTWLNPALTLEVTWFGQRALLAATDLAFSKWTPRDPTSAHWYSLERFTRLVGAYIADDADKGRSRTVREFVGEFRGLSGSGKGKAVLAEVDLARERLADLVIDDRVDPVRTGRLLEAMREHSKPVKPAALGTIGREHFALRFEALGCEMESFQYRKLAGYDQNDIPCVIEVAFAWRGDDDDGDDGDDDEEPENDDEEEGEEEEEEENVGRRLITGVNWSPGIGNPFRSLGPYGTSLDSILSEQECDADEPVIVVIHVAYPVATHLDRGKGSVTGAITKTSAIPALVESVTDKWAKQRKQEEKQASARRNRANVLIRRRTVSIKEAARQIMEKAYLKASAGGTLPAHARQIMYAARPHIQATTTRDLSAGFDQYFIQTLLNDYIEEWGVTWNVVYDARGHFHEPHTEHEVPLGTLQVREYLSDVRSYVPPALDFKLAEEHFPTFGPQNRYGAVLFIEKEGFMPLFEAVKLGERYDLAIMSTKGMSVTACRRLAEELCGPYHIPLLLLHDFDKSGFSIAGTLQRDTRRYKFSRSFAVHDLGLRLDDVGGLETEFVTHQASNEAVAANLAENGATKEEIGFLLSKRVELNAFASDELVAFIESKLDAVGIKKVVPEAATLKAACQRARAKALINRELDALVAKATEQAAVLADLPDLAERIRAILEDEPEIAWDAALARIADEFDSPPPPPL